MGQQEDEERALTVACPRCRAQPGIGCRNQNNRPQPPHRARTEASAAPPRSAAPSSRPRQPDPLDKPDDEDEGPARPGPTAGVSGDEPGEEDEQEEGDEEQPPPRRGRPRK
jgi:hypothetical protein